MHKKKNYRFNVQKQKKNSRYIYSNCSPIKYVTLFYNKTCRNMISIIFSGSPVFEQVANSVKKAFNPYFNPSEFIIQSVVLPLIFWHFCGNILFSSSFIANLSGKCYNSQSWKREIRSICKLLRKKRPSPGQKERGYVHPTGHKKGVILCLMMTYKNFQRQP